MAFNDLLRQLGGIGRFQKAQVTLIILPMLLMASHNTLQNFTAAVPPHHCRPPASANLSRDGELEAWLPRDGQGRPESCLRFTSPQRGLPFPNGTEANGTEATEPCTNGWIYDNSTFPSTIVTEWDLVCSHRALRQLAQSLYMVGVLLGAIVFGHLADRLGRRKVLILSHLQMAASGTCTAFAPSFPVYCAFRLLSGMSTSGIILNSMTLNMEWMPIHTRAYVSTLAGYVFSLGQFILAGAAYAVPHWRYLQLLVSVPFFVSFVYSWFFIESARWYASSGRLDLTLKALQRVAQINRKREEGAKLNMEGLRSSLQKELTMGPGSASALELLRHPALRRLFLCLSVLWQTGLGMGSTMARVGSIASPLVSMTAELFPSMPLFIYGTVPVVASTVAALLPETLGHPLPDTVQDLEDRRRGKPQRQQQEQQKQMVPLQASAQEKNGL
uniref:Solute carrier family 22 member 6 n=1 Tax=Myotis myotis TaxID=51298 RepID=A0A7J7RHU5_MYOMY|nr:solute carrier family 22 member 6 [Myotis myotis]